MKTLVNGLVTCLLVICGYTCADIFSPASEQNLSPGGPLLSTAPTFLPVEEAYQLHPSVAQNTLILDWFLAPGYYLYQQRFNVQKLNSLAQPTTMQLSTGEGVRRYDDYYEKELVVYYDQTRVTTPIPATGIFVVRVESQACADAGLCYPPRTHYLQVDIDNALVTETVSPLTQQNDDILKTSNSTDTSVAMLLIFALLGGLLLNLMPCVFPVLSIKALSIATSGLSTSGRHHHGIAYTLGVISAFLVIAVILNILRAGGQALGWGFQLQSPLFVTFLIYLFFIMGLSFSGFYEAGARLMNAGQASTQGQGLKQSYFTGVLATVVASPCSAPFMGTALGAALTQTTTVGLLIFSFLGLGMALPFLVLTWVPSLASRLPKPGPWMVSFKEFLAYPLYFTSAWLLWVLGRQTGSDMVSVVLCGMIFLALAIWSTKKHSPIRLTLAALSLLAAITVPLAFDSSDEKTTLWEPYSTLRLEQLLNDQQAVFINLTASWCITCLANEKLALSSDSFANSLQQNNIIYLKGDWTNYNPEITALLNANKRSGVPLYLFYPAGVSVPQVLPQILTQNLITNILSNKIPTK